MVKPPKAFAPGNCNAWPDSRCSSKQYFSIFYRQYFYNISKLAWLALFLQTIFLKLFPALQCSSSALVRLCMRRPRQKVINPRLHLPPVPTLGHLTFVITTPQTPPPSLQGSPSLLRFKLHLTLIFIQVQAVDFYVLPFCLATLSNKHQDMQVLYQPIS